MTDQSNPPPPRETPARGTGRRVTLVIAFIAVAIVAGATANMLSTAFGQGFGWHHGGWHDGAFGGPLTPAQIDDRIDRMTKHMAIELDATADQQGKIAAIFK